MDGHKFIQRGPVLQRIVTSDLGELLVSGLKQNKDKIILTDGHTNEELSGKQLLSKSIALAKWFQNVGITVGDSITIISENCLEFAITTVATFLSGAALAPLNSDYTVAELKHGLSLSKPKIVLCSKKTVDKMSSVLPSHLYIRKLVLFGNDDYANPKVIKLNDILQGLNEIDEDFKAVSVNPQEATATILCSSGTTGLPKGVMCTHDNIVTFLNVSISNVLFKEITDPDENTLIGLAPFFHGLGFMIMLLTILSGSKIVIMRKFTPALFLQVISKFKIGRLLLPPAVFLTVIKDPALLKQYDLSCLKEIRCGAAPLGKEMEDQIKESFNVPNVTQAYGMTETTLGVLMYADSIPIRTGSVGKVVPGMIGKVVDEKGELQGPYDQGELCFKGPLIMKGYIGNPEATAEIIDKDGWLHTGDIGYYDEDGYFFIVDRLKELIKYKAFQVAPAELEDLLLSHPNVKDAAVVGLPDADAGELPLAFIVKKPDVEVTEEELKKLVADTLSHQKRLRGGVVFVEEIPKNPTGKILRRVLKDRAKDLVKVKSKL